MYILLEFLKYAVDLRDNEYKESFSERIIKRYIDKQRYEDDYEELKKRWEEYKRSKK